MILDLKRVKAERIAKGFTTKAMADLLNMRSRSSYTNRENGDIPMEVNTLLLIAQAFDCPMANFFIENVPDEEHKGCEKTN